MGVLKNLELSPNFASNWRFCTFKRKLVAKSLKGTEHSSGGAGGATGVHVKGERKGGHPGNVYSGEGEWL